MADLKYNVAGTDSNSYVSRDEMDDFLDECPTSAAKTAWQALSADDRKRFLILACRMIDRAHEYIGQKVSDLTGDAAQALKFPRMSFEYAGGKANIEAYRGSATYAIDGRVKRAQMIQALWLCQRMIVEAAPGPLGGSIREQLQAEGVTSISIGNTSESYDGKGRNLCAEAEDELRPLVRRSSRI